MSGLLYEDEEGRFVEPPPLILATLDTGSFTFEALAMSREHADEMLAQAWLAHRLDYPDAQGWDVWKDDVNYSDIKIGDVLRDGETLVTTGPPR